MNLPSKIISTAVIALTIGLSSACWSSDATPAPNEPTNPPAATATAFPPPTDEPKRQMSTAPVSANRSVASSSDSNLPDDQRWCLAWALDSLQPHVYAECKQLDPTTMDDLDRVIWRSKMEQAKLRGAREYGYPSSTLPIYTHDTNATQSTRWEDRVGTCWMYWSEPLNKNNGEKRNFQYEAECLRSLSEQANTRWGDLAEAAFGNNDTTAYEKPNQQVRVLKWLDTPGRKLLKMDEPPYETFARLHDKPWAYDSTTSQSSTDFDIQWAGIIWAASSTHCHLYYPQLFYGYWVPLNQRTAEPPDQLSAEELAEVKRLREGPLYLPRP